DALQLLSLIRQPFFFMSIAEELVPHVDVEDRTRLAELAWARAAESSQFDIYSPAYTLSLWIAAVALWPLEHPERRRRLEWLEHWVSSMPHGELEPSQDYGDLRLEIARRWAELGELERARAWVERVGERDEIHLLELVEHFPVTERIQMALDVLAGVRIIQEENGYVSWRLAELVARDCPEALNAVLARLRSDFLPLARLEWLLAFVPHVAPEVAHALWHEACDLFEATV